MSWRDKYKVEEQAWMILKDQYGEVARAMGFASDAWFGDPFADHSEVVARAKSLAARGTAEPVIEPRCQLTLEMFP